MKPMINLLKVCVKRFLLLSLVLLVFCIVTTVKPGVAAPQVIAFMTTGIYSVEITTTDTYTLTAVGAHGGENQPQDWFGGTGATIIATFDLIVGDILTIIVGDNGQDGAVDPGSGGGGGGGTSVILNGADVLIAAGGGGGANRGGFGGGGGRANTNSTPGAGASPNGGGGGGFNTTAPNPGAGTCPATEGGEGGTLSALGIGGLGFSAACGVTGGDGGQGFGGGGGANARVGGGGGGYLGGSGSTSNSPASQADSSIGGDSFVNTSVRNGTVVSAIAGTDNGSTGPTDADGSVTIDPDGLILSVNCGIQAAAEPANYTFTGITGLTIQVVNDGTDLDCLAAARVTGNHPNATPPLQTGEYFVLHAWTSNRATQAVADWSVNLTLPTTFTPDANDKVCRYTGTGFIWDCAMTSFTATTITRNGVTQFSDWAAGDNVGPTAVTLTNTTGQNGLPGVTLVFWFTALLLAGITLLVWQKQANKKKMVYTDMV